MKRQKSFKIIEKILLIIIPLIFFLFTYEKPQKEEEKPENHTETVQQENPPEKKPSISENQNNYGTLFNEEITDFIINEINNAQSEIKGVTYTFSNKKIAAALKEATERGVNVSIFYGKGSNIQHMDGVYLRTMDRGILHEKFLIIDDIILISSSNLSSDKSSNSAIWFKNAPNLKTILEKEISDLFAPVYNKKCEKGCSFEYGKIYFSPGKNCTEIKKEITTGQKETFLALYTATLKNPMMSGIKQQLTKKVKVSSIMDNWNVEEEMPVNKKACSYIKNRGGKCEMWDEKEQGKKFHHKFALIDNKKLIFGSMNWTSSGCYKNREITIVTENEEIVSGFVKYKDELKSSFGL